MVHRIQVKLAFIAYPDGTMLGELVASEETELLIRPRDGSPLQPWGVCGDIDRLNEVLRGPLTCDNGWPLVLASELFEVLAIATGPPVVTYPFTTDASGLGIAGPRLPATAPDQPTWELFDAVRL